MNILAIDIGSYSIKFVEVKAERKNYTLLEKQEIIMDEARAHYPNISLLSDLQKEIVANYIQKKPNDTKIIFQLPNEILTTRFMEIPGSSKRKTEQIIPFQLEESLPYPLANAHFSSRIVKNNNGFFVTSSIAQLGLFKDFFQYFETKEVEPTILTCEISIVQAYIDHIRMNESCCILDLGHKTTKIYFVHNRQIVSNHTSFIAGSSINEVIAKTYQISMEDAIIYKHENAFMLSDEQLEEVSPEQKNFGLLMKQIFNPLILDLRRLEIGHKVKFGTKIEKIFILGGTSQINNIDNFLNYHTGLDVESLPPLLDLKNDYTIHDKNFYLAKMLSLTQKNPGNLINFLTGKYQTSSGDFVSLYSAVFIGVRTTALALLLIFGLLTEKYLFLQKENKNSDAKIKSLLKRSNLGFSSPERKFYDKNPGKILTLMKKKNKIIKDEVNSILSSQSVNALKPLLILSKMLTNNPLINLEKFTSDGSSVNATFTANDPIQLEKIKTLLEKSNLSRLEIKYTPGQKILKIHFEDR